MRLASTRSAPPTNHPLTKPRSKLYVVMRLSLQGATSGAAWPWSFRYTVHGATTLVFQSPPRGFPVHWLHHIDRKSTRLNSSHLGISYAVFCLKKNNIFVTKVAVLVALVSGPLHIAGIARS